MKGRRASAVATEWLIRVQGARIVSDPCPVAVASRYLESLRGFAETDGGQVHLVVKGLDLEMQELDALGVMVSIRIAQSNLEPESIDERGQAGRDFLRCCSSERSVRTLGVVPIGEDF